MKNWHKICFVIFKCHMFSSFSFGANLLFVLWLFLIFHCPKAGFVPYPGHKLMVPDFATRDCEYCWCFLLAKTDIQLKLDRNTPRHIHCPSSTSIYGINYQLIICKHWWSIFQWLTMVHQLCPQYTTPVHWLQLMTPLTHCGPVKAYVDIDLGQHWLR